MIETRATIQKLLDNRNFVQVDQLLAERLKKNSSDTEALYFAGVSYYFQGQVGKSIERLRSVLAIDPHHTDASACLAILYNDIGKYDEAKRVFEMANHSLSYKRSGDDPSIDKKFSIKHLEIADLYFRYRRFDEAIEEYSKASTLDPTSLEIRIRRAKAYAKKGFVTRAIQELQQVKAENPTFLPGRLQLGLLYYSQGNVLDAELEWEGVKNIEPHHREALAYLEMAKGSR